MEYVGIIEETFVASNGFVNTTKRNNNYQRFPFSLLDLYFKCPGQFHVSSNFLPYNPVWEHGPQSNLVENKVMWKRVL